MCHWSWLLMCMCRHGDYMEFKTYAVQLVYLQCKLCTAMKSSKNSFYFVHTIVSHFCTNRIFRTEFYIEIKWDFHKMSCVWRVIHSRQFIKFDNYPIVQFFSFFFHFNILMKWKKKEKKLNNWKERKKLDVPPLFDFN